MRILEHRALRGPNYYSRYLSIYMRLDIEELEQRPSDKVSGIAERLEALIPTINEHRCSVGEPGGFLQRVRAGTYAGHMVEHVALELQNMVGFSVGYGKTVDTTGARSLQRGLPLSRRGHGSRRRRSGRRDRAGAP
ncbi:MAG: hypothetical protein U5R48_02945 [Gammaproteobacteria bacterium]|nr:hypothetical protein [Gammaproteobacteria bacterium]